MRNFRSSIILISLVLIVNGCTKSGSVVWQEEDGIVRIEAEEGFLNSQDSGWKIHSGISGFHGKGYIIWEGKGNWGPESKPYDSIPAEDKITYQFKITSPGLYYVKVRNYHKKVDGDNDTWTSVNKSEWGKTYDWQVMEWSLDERGEWAKYNFSAGIHTVELAGRSIGFAVDQIIIFEESLKRSFIPESSKPI